MKMNANIGIGFLTFLLCEVLMAEPLPQNWVTIRDEQTGIQVDFPHSPLEMTFEIPFQNTPLTGQIHLYSFPTQTGILVLSIYTSQQLNDNWLKKENFYQFFETILVPHLFFNPAIFYDHQTFTYEPKQINGEKAASFQISHRDQEDVKKLEGIAMIRENTLYTYFYLTSEKSFDQELFKRFLNSVLFQKVRRPEV